MSTKPLRMLTCEMSAWAVSATELAPMFVDVCVELLPMVMTVTLARGAKHRGARQLLGAGGSRSASGPAGPGLTACLTSTHAKSLTGGDRLA